MAITIEINGTARTVEAGTLNVDWKLNNRGVASFVSDAVVPSVGQSVVIKDAGTRVWGGTIEDVTPFRRGGAVNSSQIASCSAVTFDQRLSKRFIASKVYGGYFDVTTATSTLNARSHGLANGNIIQVKTTGTLPGGLAVSTKYYIVAAGSHTFQVSLSLGGAAVGITTLGTGLHRFLWYAGSVVQNVVNNYIVGELAGTPVIADGSPLEPTVCDYYNVGSFFDLLATVSNYVWYVSPDEELMFFSRTAYNAPFSIGDAGTNFIDIQIVRSRSDFRDVQYVRGNGEIYVPEYASFLGDGTVVKFGLNYPVAAVRSMFLNSVAVEFGVWGVDTGKKFYWSFGSETIWQDTAETVLVGTDTLEVYFLPVGGNVTSDSDAAVIAARSAVEGGTGRYERLDDDSVSTNVAGVQATATALLTTGKVIPDRITISTDTAGLEPGQVLAVNLTLFGINTNFLIQEVTAHDAGNFLRYTATAVTSSIFLDYVDFFKGLSSGGAGGSSSGGGGSVSNASIFSEGWQAVAGAGTINLSLVDGRSIQVTLDRATTTINAPTGTQGSRWSLLLVNDATAGRAVTWGTNFPTSIWSPPPSARINQFASGQTWLEFVIDSTGKSQCQNFRLST